jgi:hypothetical protein
MKRIHPSASPGSEFFPMILDISAVLLFGAASVFAVKTKSAGGGAALVLFLFGFFAAGTGAYEPIHNLVQASADALSALDN